MKIFKYLKDLYKGEHVLANHITLFSLIGIMIILFVSYSADISNVLFPYVYIAPAASSIESTLEIFWGSLILVYLIGYSFTFCNSRFIGKNDGIPDFKFVSFYFFLRLLPVFIVWVIYYMIALFAGIYIISKLGQVLYSYIFGAIMLCIIPFVVILLVDFSKFFKYDRHFFNPYTIFRYFDKYLGKVLVFSFQLFILFIIFVIAMSYIPYGLIKSEHIRLAVWLMSLCLGCYVLFIGKCVCYNAFVSILSEKNDKI